MLIFVQYSYREWAQCFELDTECIIYRWCVLWQYFRTWNALGSILAAYQQWVWHGLFCYTKVNCRWAGRWCPSMSNSWQRWGPEGGSSAWYCHQKSSCLYIFDANQLQTTQRRFVFQELCVALQYNGPIGMSLHPWHFVELKLGHVLTMSRASYLEQDFITWAKENCRRAMLLEVLNLQKNTCGKIWREGWYIGYGDGNVDVEMAHGTGWIFFNRDRRFPCVAGAKSFAEEANGWILLPLGSMRTAGQLGRGPILRTAICERWWRHASRAGIWGTDMPIGWWTWITLS